MSKKSRSFRDLVVWQRAHRFVLDVYALTQSFPRSELYGLTGQMRRAAVSIPANIVEGFRRRTKSEKVHFLSITQGSLEESRYYLLLAQDLGYGEPTRIEALGEEVSKLLVAYSNAIQHPERHTPISCLLTPKLTAYAAPRSR